MARPVKGTDEHTAGRRTTVEFVCPYRFPPQDTNKKSWCSLNLKAVKLKSRFVPLHAVEALGGRGEFSFWLVHKMGASGQCHSPAVFHSKRNDPRYPLDRLQSRSRHTQDIREILSLPRIEPWLSHWTHLKVATFRYLGFSRRWKFAMVIWMMTPSSLVVFWGHVPCPYSGL